MKDLKHLKKFEEIVFDFDENDWEDIEKEKLLSADRKGVFVNFEKEFLEKWGFIADGRNFIDDQKYYRLVITKYIQSATRTALFCQLQDLIAHKTIGLTVELLENDLTRENRIKSLKKLMKKIYIYLQTNGIDEETIKKKEALRIKMKDIDPYQEEQWEDEK